MPNFVHTKCPACDSLKVSFAYQSVKTMKYDEYRVYVDTYVDNGKQDPEPFLCCTSCGLIFRNPIQENSIGGTTGAIDKKSDRAAYEKSYDNHTESFEAEEYKPLSWLLEVAGSGGGSALDVGCQFGFVVRELCAAGWMAQGIDPSTAADVGKEKLKLDIRRDYYGLDSYPECSFDLIVGECVMYYFPITFLQASWRQLKPGALLYLLIPETKNIGVNFMPNYTRAIFSLDSSKNVFSYFGFEVVAQTREGFTPGTFGVVLKKREGQVVVDQVDPGFLSKIRKDLVLADYHINNTRFSLALAPVLNVLHAAYPGGIPTRIFAKLLRKIVN